MAKVAELAHSRHTKNARFRLGRAPYYEPDNLNFVQVDARQKFIEVVNHLARPAIEVLLELAAAHEYHADNCPLDEWARRFNLTKGGHIAGWVLYSARVTIMGWQAIPQLRVPLLMDFQQVEIPVKASTLTSADCRVVLDVAWNPLGPALSVPGSVPGETCGEFLNRVRKQAKAEIERIVRSVKRRGAQPCPEKREPQHFDWAVRFQVLKHSVPEITGCVKGAELETRAVTRAISQVLDLIGLTRRPEKPGPKPTNLRH